ncbi:MAG: molybdenum cofactor biosynthesis protein [Elusimicrobia bacterium HGW-Elusimicrobia-1]|jgi:molybdenum cofactor synthesis domain-containing protein|nr:MAG: molybdenum cofactor biosynthesis protein [Elusimicrobia bacterium HGW-Elusimicrobia-1]
MKKHILKINDVKAAVLTCSDKGSRGLRRDTAGPAVEKTLSRLQSSGLDVKITARLILPDERKQIGAMLKKWCDTGIADVIFTVGGTGMGPRDCAPEATRDVMDKLCPGIPELIRWESFKITKHAALSRATAGIRKKTLIINLPGSQKAARQTSAALLAILPHAVELLRGHTEH